MRGSPSPFPRPHRQHVDLGRHLLPALPPHHDARPAPIPPGVRGHRRRRDSPHRQRPEPRRNRVAPSDIPPGSGVARPVDEPAAEWASWESSGTPWMVVIVVGGEAWSGAAKPEAKRAASVSYRASESVPASEPVVVPASEPVVVPPITKAASVVPPAETTTAVVVAAAAAAASTTITKAAAIASAATATPTIVAHLV